MKIVNERIAGASREIDGFVESFGRFYGEAIGIDHGGGAWLGRFTNADTGATGVPHKVRQPGIHDRRNERDPTGNLPVGSQ